MTQLPIEGIPEPIGIAQAHFGYLYVCLGENAVVKIGRSATITGKRRRINDHRKHEPTMREVCSLLIPHVVHEETALRRILADYVESRVAGHEWFYLDAYTGDQIIRFMAHRGADTTIMERAFAEAITRRARREWTDFA